MGRHYKGFGRPVHEGINNEKYIIRVLRKAVDVIAKQDAELKRTLLSQLVIDSGRKPSRLSR
jgi:hypothetical protein